MTSLVELRAGNMSMLFCPQLAFLRHLVWLNDNGSVRETVRGIFPAVRNQDWETMPFQVSGLQIDRGQDHFCIRYRAECIAFPFRWQAELLGNSQGRVSYRFDGVATDRLLKNRIGLCVLHPIEPCAGVPCQVEHVDGSITRGVFPRWVSPHQPFKQIRAITHPVAAGVDVTTEFEGEVFEMEDQRNWTDASFKTYSTPLELPFPVAIQAGTKIAHQVTIHVSSVDSGSAPFLAWEESRTETRVSLNWSEVTARPTLGLAMASGPHAADPAAVERLAEMRLDHLRVDIDLESDDWLEIVTHAHSLAERIGTQIEIATFVDRTHVVRLEDFMQWITTVSRRVARVLLHDSQEKVTPPWLIDWATHTWQQSALQIPVVFGTNAYFAELNRGRAALRDQSLVCYSINPQVHAFDEMSLCETFEGQRATVDSAAEFFHASVVVSPVTLRPRFNPNATSVPESCERAEPESDPRQSSDFAAAWTVGSLGQLATSRHVSSITLYETVGPRGIMTRDGQMYPLGEVIAAVLKCKACVLATINRPLQIAAIGLVHEDGSREILLANLTESEQTVVLELPASASFPLALSPHSVESLDVTR